MQEKVINRRETTIRSNFRYRDDVQHRLCMSKVVHSITSYTRERRWVTQHDLSACVQLEHHQGELEMGYSQFRVRGPVRDMERYYPHRLSQSAFGRFMRCASRQADR